MNDYKVSKRNGKEIDLSSLKGKVIARFESTVDISIVEEYIKGLL